MGFGKAAFWIGVLGRQEKIGYLGTDTTPNYERIRVQKHVTPMRSSFLIVRYMTVLITTIRSFPRHKWSSLDSSHTLDFCTWPASSTILLFTVACLRKFNLPRDAQREDLRIWDMYFILCDYIQRKGWSSIKCLCMHKYACDWRVSRRELLACQSRRGYPIQ